MASLLRAEDFWEKSNQTYPFLRKISLRSCQRFNLYLGSA